MSSRSGSLRASVTYYIDPDYAAAQLDYSDMVALSGLFRRWALYESELDPADCTRMICWSADFERLAKSLGRDWVAADPTDSLIHFIAVQERTSSIVIDAKQLFQAMRTGLGT